MGTDDDPEAGAGVNGAAEVLSCLPGIGAKNVEDVMGKVGGLRELCELGVKGVQNILGVEPGSVCWEFMHRGDR
jgi:DNA excision repair protein ERCC-4